MMDLQRLRIYRAVVAAGSIQGAAANLGYTPSAVSQQVAALSRETGLALIGKAGRGIEPTDAGLELVAAAERLFGELAEVEARVSDLREGRAGSLSPDPPMIMGSGGLWSACPVSRMPLWSGWMVITTSSS